MAYGVVSKRCTIKTVLGANEVPKVTIKPFITVSSNSPVGRFLTVSHLGTNVGSFLDCADSQANSLECFPKVRKGAPS